MRPDEVVAVFSAAWADHDLAAALALISDDCIFDTTDPPPDGRVYVGRKAIGAAWAPIFADASSRFDSEETFSADDRVVQRWVYRWSSGHVRGVDILRVRGDLIAEKLSYVKG